VKRMAHCGSNGSLRQSVPGWLRLLPAASLLIKVLCVSAAQAWADSKIIYTPPEGEALDYEKKFYPTEVSTDWVVELNPLQLVNRSIVAESEHRIAENFTLGLDLLYSEMTVSESKGVKASAVSYGILPKVRMYPLPVLTGVYFGLKLFLGSFTATIDGAGEKKSFDQVVVAPSAHVGYRITSFSGITFSLYVGGGAHFPQLDLETADFPEAVRNDARWKDSAARLNQALGAFRPDFGLTFGAAF
jgi:hypothetical protein